MIQNILQSHLETLAMILALINTYLAARANIWNWLFGIVALVLYTIIFYQVKLYADMGLQLVFLAMQFYGWYQWLYGGSHHSVLQVRNASRFVYFTIAPLILCLFLMIAFLLSRYTDSTTIYIDAFTTALSLVAQWMMSKKWIENWWLWFMVDLISVKMYLMKSLYLTAGLYGIFLLICFFGYYTWREKLISNTTELQQEML